MGNRLNWWVSMSVSNGFLGKRLRNARQPFWYVRPRVIYRHKSLGRNLVRPEYTVSSKAFDIAYVDRTRTLDFGFPYEVRQELPDFRETVAEDFDALVNQRAVELIEFAKSSRRPLTVFWSGGIDSTLVLCALLKHWYGTRQTTPLRILLSKSSIDEYPWFFENIVRHRCEYGLLAALVSYQVRDGIAVTGELGDQVFGLLVSILEEDGSAFDLLPQPYGPFLSKIITQAYEMLIQNQERHDLSRAFGSTDPDVVSSRVVEYLNPQLAKCPFPIETVNDLLWWVQISLKWQAKELQDVHPDITYYDDRYIQHFFNTRQFQLWSYHNRKNTIRDSWASYKWQAKAYIAAETGDVEYEASKLKHNSKQHVTRDVEPIFRTRTRYKALLANGRIVRNLKKLR